MIDRDFCWTDLCWRGSSDSVSRTATSLEVPEAVVGEGKVARQDFDVLCSEFRVLILCILVFKPTATKSVLFNHQHKTLVQDPVEAGVGYVLFYILWRTTLLERRLNILATCEDEFT